MFQTLPTLSIFALMLIHGKYFFVIAVISLLFTSGAHSQQVELPVDNYLPVYFDEYYHSDTLNHTCIKPYNINDSVFGSLCTRKFNINDSSDFFCRSILKKKNGTTVFLINPLISDIFTGSGFFTENGFRTSLLLHDKLSFNLNFSYILTKQNRQSSYFNYDDIYLPHFGITSGDTSSDYRSFTNFNGNITWKTSEFLSFSAGNGKMFLGDGSRSLFISDNSGYFPHFSGIVKVWKINYIMLYSLLPEKMSGNSVRFRAKKYSSSHFLSWNVSKRLNINLFETVIWQHSDSTGTRGFDVNYLNPIIFFRPVEFSLGSPDNVIMGFGFRLRVFKTTHIYGQLLLDEFKLAELKARNGWWGNKFGIQGGIKTFRLFGFNNLYGQCEINLVRPFTYAHRNYMLNNGSYSQPLAHPLGANFAEFIAGIRYFKNRVFFSAFLKTYKQGTDWDSLNTGYNIYRSYDDSRDEFGNKILQGVEHNYAELEIAAGYVVNPEWMLLIKGGLRLFYNKEQTFPLSYHDFAKPKEFVTNNDLMFFFGLYTTIGNRDGLY